MKYILLSHNLILILLVVLISFHSNGKVTAQDIRIVPSKLYVKNDSLHVNLTIYPNGISVGSGTAFFFTPVISGRKKQSLSLPAVIISGKRRARQDRREVFLSPVKEEPQPLQRIIAGRKKLNAPINYQIVVPYASWMQHSSLLLRQEYKECCEKEQLALDTLKRSLLISTVPPAVREYEFQAKPQSRPVQGEPIQRIPVGNTTAYTYNTIPVVGKPAAPVVLNIAEVDRYAAMVSFLPSEGNSGNKHRTEGAVLYFDYPLGKDDIYLDYKNNREEINKVEQILGPLTDNRFSTLVRVSGDTPRPTGLTAIMNGWHKHVRSFLPVTCARHTTSPATASKYRRKLKTGKALPTCCNNTAHPMPTMPSESSATTVYSTDVKNN